MSLCLGGPRSASARLFDCSIWVNIGSSVVCTFLFSVFFFFPVFSFYLLYCLVSAPLTVLLSGTFADATQINYDSLFI